MPRITEQARQRGIERVWLTIKRCAPRGVTEAEIAANTSIQRRTVHNYLTELSDEGKIYKDSKLWFPTDYEETRLLSVEVSPGEAYTFYLGGRLLVKQHDKRNELAETGLLKLADKLVTDARIGQEIAQAAKELALRPMKAEYQSVFQTMITCYLQRQRVEIVYKPLNRKEFSTTFETYLIEPSAIGYSTYVIGYSSAPNALRAYKLERIQSAQPVEKSHYKIPNNFPGLEILRHSWSIILGDQLVKVVLRFSPAVKERVLETRWHPSEDHCDDPDKPGWLRWEVQVSDTMDMVPWIRGWGSHCEVLEPPQLRIELIDESIKLADLYGGMMNRLTQRHWLLWAKTNRPRNTEFHLLIYHLLDVGNTALAMWKNVFTAEFKQQIAWALGLGVDETGRLFAFLAAMHDLGKGCPSFQGHKNFAKHFKSHREAIDHAQFNIPLEVQPCRHAFVSTWALRDLLAAIMPTELAQDLAVIVGGHHGRWPTSYEWGEQSAHSGGDEWKEARKQLLQNVANIFDPPKISQYNSVDQRTQNMLFVMLAGVTSVADWIGSIAQHFRYRQNPIDLKEYATLSASSAQHALNQLGWTRWQPPTVSMPFTEQFKVTAPRKTQEEIIKLTEQLVAPFLVIIEDATGSGKSEGGMYLADHASLALGARGLYIAMPTMATSNQMHQRLAAVLQRRYPKLEIEPILIHSQARFTEKKDSEAELDLQSIDGDSKQAEVNALAWFEDDRKCSLLAPFGVGTVDQTFLSVLQTNHFFVRLFALARKTVIFDEVHAYDTYMTTIFQSLLRWLNAIGTSVVVLSATLPVATRRTLINAYGGDVTKATDTQSSAIITWVSGAKTDQIPLPTLKRDPVQVEWVEHAPIQIAQFVYSEIQAGGCIAVICNRVARAQEIYRAIKEILKDLPIVPGEDLILFHARFPLVWRNGIEGKVLKQAGKTGKRNRPFIVIATQVIEQSLDLDFDFLITDLAPIDLLIQRIGRLHRHEERDVTRPSTMKMPRVVVAKPEQPGEVPHFGSDERTGNRRGVYKRYVLLRTWLELEGETELKLPAQTRALIEAIYAGEDALPDFSGFTTAQQQELQRAWKEMRRHEWEDNRKASLRTIPDPQDNLILMDNLELTDDDSTQAQEGLSAMTRLCLPNVQLICLFENSAGRLVLGDERQKIIDLNQKPTAKLAEQLIQYSVSITRPSVYRHFRGQLAPLGWQEHSVLRNYRVAIFKKASDDEYICHLTANLSLHLSKERGVEIEQS